MPMATNKPDGNSNHRHKVPRNWLVLIRHVEEMVEKVLNREYVVKMCDTAWERLRGGRATRRSSSTH